LIIIINSTSIIQTTILTRDLNFKLQTKNGLISSVSSGVLGIILAFSGFGVWALVVRSLAESFTKSIMLWLMNRWKPQMGFSLKVLKELFGFSSKLLASAILDKIYYNIYNLVIAKYFSARELGLFTRAKMFKDLAAQTISEIVGKVSFPVFASIQNEPQRLRDNYKQVLTSTNYIIWISMFVLAAIAEPLVIALIGKQWIESVIYLQLLSFVGVFYPTHVLTRNILMVYGKSGMLFRLEIFTKALAVPAILIGVIWGIKFMILAMVFTGIVECLVKAYHSGKIVGYPILQQLKDLSSTFFLAFTVGVILYLIAQSLSTSSYITLFIQLSIGIFFIIGFSEFFKLKEYLFIKEISITQVKGLMNRKKR
jgi:O-antigen/teichoic acid export membrane protein